MSLQVDLFMEVKMDEGKKLQKRLWLDIYDMITHLDINLSFLSLLLIRTWFYVLFLFYFELVVFKYLELETGCLNFMCFCYNIYWATIALF